MERKIHTGARSARSIPRYSRGAVKVPTIHGSVISTPTSIQVNSVPHAVKDLAHSPVTVKMTVAAHQPVVPVVKQKVEKAVAVEQAVEVKSRSIANHAKAMHSTVRKTLKVAAEMSALEATPIPVSVAKPQRTGKAIDIVMTNAMATASKAETCDCADCENALYAELQTEAASYGNYDAPRSSSWSRYFSWLS